MTTAATEDANNQKNNNNNDGPIQVYIMLGQSNMLGFGAVSPMDKVGTLEYLVKHQPDKYLHLLDEQNSKNWKTLTDTCRYVQVIHKKGKMSVERNEWLTVKNRFFGPELGFGHIIGPYLASKNQRVLLIKSCIGNRSLGWDLLPPGSPSFEYEGDGKIYAGYKQTPNFWEKGTTPKPIQWYAGKQYDDDIACCKEVLSNLEQYYPESNNNVDYEIAGFVWWQGHKDTLSNALTSKYETNLVHLIHQLRHDFQAPQAKFVLATIAFNGYNMQANGNTVVNAQLAVSGENGKYPEFTGNVKTIDARPYWRSADQSPANQGHHYNQNAETFYEVGHALGQAMVELLKEANNNESKN